MDSQYCHGQNPGKEFLNRMSPISQREATLGSQDGTIESAVEIGRTGIDERLC